MSSSLGIFFQEYDYEQSKQWLIDHQPFLFKSVAFYVVAIFTIKYLQRTANHTYTHISEIHTDKTAGYWCFLWIVSKIPEFVDTFFIVLRKKPLMFMHWYHHALTGYFAFHTFYAENAYMVWVVWMNYVIHFAMYSYYGLRAMHVRISPWIAQTITTTQMIQFIITILWMTHAGFLLQTNQKVAATSYGLFIGQFMMWTYLVLWLRFYYVSYFKTGGKKFVQHKTNGVKAQ